MDNSFLYIISSSSEGPVKLGISGDPEKRLKQLQTGHAKKLHIFHMSNSVPTDKAYLYEKLLHKTLSHLRTQGEWFDVSVEHAKEYLDFVFIEHETSDLTP